MQRAPPRSARASVRPAWTRNQELPGRFELRDPGGDDFTVSYPRFFKPSE